MSELDERLRALAAEGRWPPTPDLAAGVRARVAGAPSASARRRRLRLHLPAPAVVVAAALALVVAGGLVAAPGVRSQLLRTLGLKGASVTVVKRLPATKLGTSLDLGERVTLASARRQAGFTLRRPAALGDPAEVYLDRGAVTFLYRSRSGRPVLFTQIPGSAAPFVAKIARDARPVSIAGAPGLLISGPHIVNFQTRGGEVRAEPSRLAANTLLWERDGMLLRLEAEQPAGELLRIARSVRATVLP